MRIIRIHPLITTPPEIRRNRQKLIINSSTIQRKEPKHTDKISMRKRRTERTFRLNNQILKVAKKEPHRKPHPSMAHITEHYPELEGESDDG